MSNNGSDANDNADNINTYDDDEPNRLDINSDSTESELLETSKSISNIDGLQTQNRIEDEHGETVKDLQDRVEHQLTKAESDLPGVPETLQAINNRLDEILSLLKNKKEKGKSKSRTRKKSKMNSRSKKGSQKKSKSSKRR